MPVSTQPVTRGRSFSQERRPEPLVQTQEAPVAATEAEESPDIVVMSKRRSISVGGRGKEPEPKTEDSMTDSSFSELNSSNGFGDNTLGTSAFNMKETNDLVPSPSLVEKLEGRISRISVSPVKIVKPALPTDFSLPNEAPQWVEDVFARYVKNNNMWKNPMTDRIDPEVWNVIQENKKFKIMQSFRKTNVFRCLYVMEGDASPEKLLQVYINELIQFN